MTTQNLGDPAKAVLRGKFIAIQPYLRKQENSSINNLILHLHVNTNNYKTMLVNAGVENRMGIH